MQQCEFAEDFLLPILEKKTLMSQNFKNRVQMKMADEH